MTSSRDLLKSLVPAALEPNSCERQRLASTFSSPGVVQGDFEDGWWSRCAGAATSALIPIPVCAERRHPVAFKVRPVVGDQKRVFVEIETFVADLTLVGKVDEFGVALG